MSFQRNGREWDWLEEQEAHECLRWVKQENELSRAYLDSLPKTNEIQRMLQALSEDNSPSPEFWLVGHLFRLRKSVTNRHGILEVSMKSPDGSLGTWKTIIDLDALSKADNKSYEYHGWDLASCFLRPDQSRLLLLLSNGGSDLVEVREVDIESGELMEDGFRTGPGRIFVAWLDIDHILITHPFGDGPTTKAGWPVTTYLWTRGTDLKDAQPIHSGETTDSIYLISSLGLGDHACALVTRCLDYSTFQHYIVSRQGVTEEVALPRHHAMVSPMPTTSEHMVVSLLKQTTILDRKVPSGTVIALSTNPESPAEDRLSIVYVPEDGEVNTSVGAGGLSASRSRVHMTMSKRGSERRLVFEFQNKSWKLVRSTHTATGSSATIMSADTYSDDVIAQESGLLYPTVITLEHADATNTMLHSLPAAFDSNYYTTTQHEATSKDGTAIDYLVLAPKKLEPMRGSAPTLMTGYGAFGTSFFLTYLHPMLGGISLVPWLESGGSLVIPFVRGGGERGEEWHQAARQKKRQKSYDDFIAVTEDLIKKKFTNPKHIGVFGTSNGGLLSAVMGTQRPDLFGAIVSDAPLADMLRYPYMGMGSAWIYEYGDPEDPQMAEVLYAYSPFHNIKPMVAYPPFLSTISTKDDRVGAGHARKLIARLKEVNSPNAWLYEEQDGGHAVSDTLKNLALMARRIAFFMEHLS